MQLKRKWVLALVACGFTSITISSLRADDDDDHKPAPPRPELPHGDSPRQATSRPAPPPVSLEREMVGMARAYRIITKQVADPSKNASTLLAVAELELHTINAKGAVLRAAATMPTEAAKTAKQADYQGDMVTLLRHELDLEEQLLANQNDKAVKTVADLKDLESEGHKEFRPRRKRD